jgi:hypothetical protein
MKLPPQVPVLQVPPAQQSSPLPPQGSQVKPPMKLHA